MLITMQRQIGQSPLVGRRHEIDVLRRSLALALEGHGNVVVVSGEAGIGKSRLVAEATAIAEQDGVVILRANCYENDRLLGFAPFIDLIWSFTGTRSREDASSASGSIGTYLSRLSHASMSLEGGESTESRLKLLLAWRDFILAQAADRAALLIVEDLQWCDDLSLDLIRRLARSSGSIPLFLVLTLRPDEQADPLWRLLADLRRDRGTNEVELNRLSQPETVELIRGISPQSSILPREIVDMVFQLTDGNPFFIEELIGAIVASSDSTSLPSDARARPIDRLHIPPTIQNLVLQQIGLLSPEARDLLDVAAIAGRRFEFDLIRQIINTDETELLRRLKELVGLRLVIEETPDLFTFRHALTREAVLAGLLTGERRTIHRRIAVALKSAQDRSNAAVDALAYHAFEAGLWQDALLHNYRAGEKAREVESPGAAAEYFSRAIAAARHLAIDPPISLLQARGEVYETLGQFDSAHADLTAALSLAESSGERNAKWMILMDLGFLWSSRDYDRSGAYAEQALAVAKDLGHPTYVAHSLNRLGNWQLNAGRSGDAILLHQEGLRFFEASSDIRGQASTLDLLGLAASHLGNLVHATDYYERAVTLYRSLGDRRGLVASLTILAEMGAEHVGSPLTVLVGDDPYRSIRLAREAVAAAHEIEWIAGEAYACLTLSLCLSGQGEYDDALRSALLGLSMAEGIEHRQWIVIGHVALASIYLEMFVPDLAQAELDCAHELVGSLESAYLSNVINSLQVSTSVLLGDVQRARLLLPTRTDAADEVFDRVRAFSLRAEIELALLEGDPGRGLQIVDRFVDKTCETQPRDFVSLHIWLARVRALTQLDRVEEAEALLQSLLEKATARGHRPILWRTHVALAELARKAGRRVASAREIAAARVAIDELALGIPDDPDERLGERTLRAEFHARASALIPVISPPSTLQTAKESYDGLTRREREVAVLVVQGKSNREIAEALFIGERTIQTHVGNIFAKLGFNSRAQVAAWAVQSGLTSATE